MKICRNCRKKEIHKVFTLGKLNFTGKFPANYNSKLGKGELGLSFCNKCKLVQLNKSYNTKYLFSKDYGYKTGINFTMRNHMKNIYNLLVDKVKLSANDYVLDIASNDGTLLNFFSKKIVKVGVDPILNRYKNEYINVKYKIADFFSINAIKKRGIQKKFKIITALSVFYDLDNPNAFLKDVEKVLHNDGICLIEHADLYSIIKLNMFDTICHEHAAYYSTKIMMDMAKKNNLRVFDLKHNDINGGSTQYFICKKNSKHKENYKTIKKVLLRENKIGLNKRKTIVDFYKRVLRLKLTTVKKVKNLVRKNKLIIGYGASTKGNVLLQYYKIQRDFIKFVADRNPYKHGRYTPGTNLQIISEKKARQMRPDYFFVLPWHFKKEILLREKVIRKKGTKMIFPLPNLKIV